MFQWLGHWCRQRVADSACCVSDRHIGLSMLLVHLFISLESRSCAHRHPVSVACAAVLFGRSTLYSHACHTVYCPPSCHRGVVSGGVCSRVPQLVMPLWGGEGTELGEATPQVWPADVWRLRAEDNHNALNNSRVNKWILRWTFRRRDLVGQCSLQSSTILTTGGQ